MFKNKICEFKNVIWTITLKVYQVGVWRDTYPTRRDFFFFLIRKLNKLTQFTSGSDKMFIA